MQILKKNERYKDAIQKAWKKVISLEPKNVVSNALVEFKEECYFIPMLDEIYSVNPKEKKIYLQEENELVEGSLGVLLLHYIINTKPVRLTNRLITYRELEGGNVYYDAFKNSTIDLIKQKFSNDLELFKKASLKLGGRKVSLGEMSFEFRFFPRISLIYVLWEGDEEISGNANILFDSSIGSQMHTEDIAVMGRTTTFRLLRSC